MRVTIVIDSMTRDEAYDATLALQRTAGLPTVIQRNETEDPQVRVMGSCLTWTSPYLHPVRVPAFWAEFHRLTVERAQHVNQSEAAMLDRFHQHTCLDSAHIGCRKVLGLPTTQAERAYRMKVS